MYSCISLRCFLYIPVDADLSTITGVRLNDEASPLLHKIAEHFTDFNDVQSLAVYLLEDIDQGGLAFITNLSSPGTHLPPTKMALSVFQKWCRRKPSDAFGGRLLEVLEKENVHPSAAHHFRHELLPDVTSSKRLTLLSVVKLQVC